MIFLENIPQISPEVFGVVEHEFIQYRDESKHLDIEFIEYVKEHNKGIAKIIKMFLPFCRDDHSYRLMMSAMIILTKAIDIQLDINKLEKESCLQK